MGIRLLGFSWLVSAEGIRYPEPKMAYHHKPILAMPTGKYPLSISYALLTTSKEMYFFYLFYLLSFKIWDKISRGIYWLPVGSEWSFDVLGPHFQ